MKQVRFGRRVGASTPGILTISWHRLLLCMRAFGSWHLAVAFVALVTLAPIIAEASPPGWNMTPIRGVLLIGKFRTQFQLDGMTAEDQRNTLIVELSNRTRDTVRFYQGLNDRDLAGAGELLIYLRGVGSRTDAQIKQMSTDDMRNVTIVEVAGQTGRRDLQGLSNVDLVRLVAGPQGQFIRGVLLIGSFRNQADLNGMSSADQRGALVAELAIRTNNPAHFYRGLTDADLAGAGALLVYMRLSGSRTDDQIKRMSIDDMRNTVIVEMHEQTRRIDLQSLSNIQLAWTMLGFIETRDPASLPANQRPGQHSVVLISDRHSSFRSVRSLSDQPFIGTFDGHGTDCSHGGNGGASSAGDGADLVAVVGWGQTTATGANGGDACFSWVFGLGVDFDVTPFAAIPGKRLDRAIFSVAESAATNCAALVFTQGGFLVEGLPCWTNNKGEAEKKAGCLALQIATEDWENNPPQGRPINARDPGGWVTQVAPQSWDVTSLFNARSLAGFGRPSANDLGVGYLLTGTISDVNNLDATDNSRCTSSIGNIRIDVTYTVPPIQPQYENDVK